MSTETGTEETAHLSAVAGRLLEWLDLGGPVVLVLIAMSVLALTIAIVKLWQFRGLGHGDVALARRALELHKGGGSAQALILVERSRKPVSGTLAQALRGARDGLPEEKVREAVLRHGHDVLESLRSGFRTLEVIASLAPLLGLLGTVLGMIEAFQRLEEAGNRVDASILSGGIWEALLTTAVGLVVAIPVVAVFNWLERRVERLAHEMESIAARVYTVDLSGDLRSEEGDATAGLRNATPLARR